jgi:hypothetical protein
MIPQNNPSHNSSFTFQYVKSRERTKFFRKKTKNGRGGGGKSNTAPGSFQSSRSVFPVAVVNVIFVEFVRLLKNVKNKKKTLSKSPFAPLECNNSNPKSDQSNKMTYLRL